MVRSTSPPCCNACRRPRPRLADGGATAGQPGGVDLLGLGDRDVLREPLRTRRRELESLLATAPSALVLSPATRDRAEACQWLDTFAAAQIGIEGMVAKGLGQTYKPGEHGWLKFRYRSTVEVIVGAVTGTLVLDATPGRAVAFHAKATGASVPLPRSLRR